MRKHESILFSLCAAVLIVVMIVTGAHFGRAARQQMETAAALPAPHPSEFVAVVKTATGSGSAIPLFRPHPALTIFLTARHVVVNLTTDGQTTIQIPGIEARIVRIELHPDESVDAALVWADSGEFPLIPLALYGPSIGDRVTAIGWISGRYRILGEGLVSQLGLKNFTSTASIDMLPGCSGGAVLNERGHVIGIVVECISYSTPFAEIPVGACCVYTTIEHIWTWIHTTR